MPPPGRQWQLMSDSRLQKLLDKRAQIEAQIRDAAARQRQQERKDDTRRKVIIGALAKEHMDKNPGSEFARKLRSLLEEYVTRPSERNLLGLAPLEDTPANDQAADEPKSGGGLKQEFTG